MINAVFVHLRSTSGCCLSLTLAVTTLGLSLAPTLAQSPTPTPASEPTVQKQQEEQLLQKVNRSMPELRDTPKTEEQQLQQQQDRQWDETEDLVPADPVQNNPDEFEVPL
jgi:hypothetical protein